MKNKKFLVKYSSKETFKVVETKVIEADGLMSALVIARENIPNNLLYTSEVTEER